MPTSTSITDFEVFRANQTEPITIFVKDPVTGQLIDVNDGSVFTLIDISNDTAVLARNFGPDGGGIVTHPATGTYQVSFDGSTYTGEYLAAFRCMLTGEILNLNVYVKSASAKTFSYAAILRSQVDKSRKSVKDYIANIDRPNEPYIELFYGYSDAHLIFYLERGAQLINLRPPYTALTVDTFPFATSGTLLIDAATIAALEAQGIFAIDTDFDYSLGGNSFVIDHFTKLSAMVSSVLDRFSANIRPFKNMYLSKGAVLYQFTPGGIRDMRYLAALPSGFWSRLYSGNM